MPSRPNIQDHFGDRIFLVQETPVENFERYYGIRSPDWWPQGKKLLSALLAGHNASEELLASASPRTLGSEPTFGVLCHLADRAREHTSASIICFSTKNAATAEVAARVAIESTVNLRFILRGDRNSLFLAWLRAYVASDAKQIEQWERAVSELPPDQKRHHTGRIGTRRQLNRYRLKFLRTPKMNSQPSGMWIKLLDGLTSRLASKLLERKYRIELRMRDCVRRRTQMPRIPLPTSCTSAVAATHALIRWQPKQLPLVNSWLSTASISTFLL